MTSGERFDFASDNTAAICPEAWEKLQSANRDPAPSYGEDDFTRRLSERVREIFERDCDVYLVFNGTAANALALAQLGAPFTSVLCHEDAHIANDECGACEMLAHGSKLVTTRGRAGKMEIPAMEDALARQRPLHSHQPRVLSLTQATELGTVYTRDELGALTAFARKHGLRVHMDGARFANALVRLDSTPAEMTWRRGVDALSFGGTKNGLAAGELVVFFDRQLSVDFDYRAKQAGQLASKMRYLAAPWLGLLENDVWLKNARHANAAAERLSARLVGEAGFELAFPCEANAVFVKLPEAVFTGMQTRGWHFYKFLEPDIYRLMCSWATREEAIDEFVREAVACR